MNNDTKKTISAAESYSISIIRVASMFMIILCHMCQVTSGWVTSLGQVFNVAVPIFFFISGFLNFRKPIQNKKKWILHRFIRILIPYYICILFFTVLNIISGNAIDVAAIISSVLNIQGFTHKYLECSQHLWFVSIIMICYLSSPLIQQKNLLNNKNFSFFCILCVCAQVFIATVYYNNLYILSFASYIGYFIIYIFGGVVFKYWERLYSRRHYTYISLCMILMNGLRCLILVSGRNTEITNSIYERVITSWSHITLAVFITYIFYLVSKYIYGKNKLLMKVILRLDSISYEVYIVHQLFVYGKYSLMRITDIYFINVLISLVVIFIFATVIHFLCFNIINKLVKRISL